VFPTEVSNELGQLQEALEEVNVDITEALQPILDAGVYLGKRSR
jgi:hypothetical protein